MRSLRFLGLTLFVSTVTWTYAATCTFNGGGDGTSWSDGSNWSCGSAPDPSSDDVIIPDGFNVINDGGDDFSFSSGHTLTIGGTLDMEGKKIEMTCSTCLLTINSTGHLFDINELFFSGDADGLIDGDLDVVHLKTDDDTELTINFRCVDVTDKFENLSSSGIIGNGCINYTGSAGNFTNTGSDGIFGCNDADVNNCSLDGGGVLPVDLLRFDYFCQNNGVKLEWETASELNNDFFTIQSSSDGQNWFDLSQIKGHGTTNQTIIYDYLITNPSAASYYRLMQTDLDGAFEIFDPIYPKCGANSNLDLSIYPNPSKRHINLVFDNTYSDVFIQLFDPVGKMIHSRSHSSTNGFELILPEESGIYFLEVQIPDVGNKTFRVIKE